MARNDDFISKIIKNKYIQKLQQNIALLTEMKLLRKLSGLIMHIIKLMSPIIIRNIVECSNKVFCITNQWSIYYIT